MNRKQRKRIASETMQILDAGGYDTGSGRVDIADALDAAVRATHLYTPEAPPAAAGPGTRATRITVANETTLAGARALREAGHAPAALNFASAWNPGGGFQTGAEAQEESLARASGLFACLNGSPFYTFHREQQDPRYSDRAIHSPAVPVFRDDAGTLLEAWWPCSFVTSAAVDRRRIDEGQDTDALMEARIALVLDVFAAHGHDAVVLGAWGCGVFRNAPSRIAALFHASLHGRHRGVFSEVRFSIFDPRDDGTYAAFEERL